MNVISVENSERFTRLFTRNEVSYAVIGQEAGEDSDPVCNIGLDFSEYNTSLNDTYTCPESLEYIARRLNLVRFEQVAINPDKIDVSNCKLGDNFLGVKIVFKNGDHVAISDEALMVCGNKDESIRRVLERCGITYEPASAQTVGTEPAPGTGTMG